MSSGLLPDELGRLCFSIEINFRTTESVTNENIIKATLQKKGMIYFKHKRKKVLTCH